MEGGVNEVEADDAKSFHLVDVFFIQEADVKEDVTGGASGFGLHAEAHPAVAFGGILVAAGADGIAVGEEGGIIAALGSESFGEDLILVVEHGLHAFSRDVSTGFTVDGVAHGHVVGRNGFGYGACGGGGAEEPVGDLLACSDFGEDAIDSRIEVELEGFFK